ncbi:uncharacterized protein YukE [Pseudomonas psychrotolerans]|nr:uncharacterized protein YukE [Pseudomonas psychrotolerans]
MLRNAPLSTKLLLILLLPLAGFLVISSLYTAERYRTLKDMQHTVTASAAAQRISAVVTRLQRERGASGVFLGSGGKAMQDKLKSFRQDSDQAQSDLRAVASSDDVALQSVLHTLDGLPELRTKVDGLGLNSTQSGTAYTDLIKALIGYTHALEAGVEDPAILRALGALNLFVEMKERAGRERVLLGLAFNQNRFEAALLSRFARNLGEFSAYADAFQRKATPAFIQQLDAAFKQPSAREVSRLQQLAFEIPLGDPLGVKPEDWFNLATQRIDLMSAVENDLGASVSVLAEQARARASRDLWTTLGLVLVVLVAVSALAWAIIRNIKQAVDQVNGTLTRLATRDLTARCAYQGRDEFGTITGNLNLMSQELGQVIQEIGAATVQVATAAEEASAVAVQTSQNERRPAAPGHRPGGHRHRRDERDREGCRPQHHRGRRRLAAGPGQYQPGSLRIAGHHQPGARPVGTGRAHLGDHRRAQAGERFHLLGAGRDPRYRRTDQPAGAQRSHRGRARRRGGPRLRRGS